MTVLLCMHVFTTPTAAAAAAAALQELEGDFTWCGSWRETYLQHRARGYKPHSHKPLEVAGFYSDFLHQPWACANVEIQQRWLEVDNIER
jgi:hypothetical protein